MPDITEVTLSRGCFWCDDQYEVAFRSDGHATRTKYGGFGQADRVYAGTVGREAFAALVATVRDEGFFEMDERYPLREEDRVEDAASSTTRVTRGGHTKAVSNVDARGPARLKRIEDAIDELAGRTMWYFDPTVPYCIPVDVAVRRVRPLKPLSPSSIQHQPNRLWRDVTDANKETAHRLQLVPGRYRLVIFDVAALADHLKAAPLEGVIGHRPAEGLAVDLPWPDGSARRVRMTESPVMSPELARQFPELRSYMAEGVSSGRGGRFSLSPTGFSGISDSESGTVYISPVRHDRQNVHVTRFHDALSPLPFCPPVPARRSVRTVEVLNDTGVQIDHLYVRPPGETRWSTDLLEDAPLQTGRGRLLRQVGCEEQDVKLQTAGECVFESVYFCTHKPPDVTPGEPVSGADAIWRILSEDVRGCPGFAAPR